MCTPAAPPLIITAPLESNPVTVAAMPMGQYLNIIIRVSYIYTTGNETLIRVPKKCVMGRNWALVLWLQNVLRCSNFLFYSKPGNTTHCFKSVYLATILL